MDREIRMNIGSAFRPVFLCAVLSLAGCAAAPTGPKFAEMALPPPPADKAMLVVFRDFAEPTALAAKIDVDGTQVFELPQTAFAYATVDPGKHAFALRWPVASGTPGWKGDAEWQVAQTYYYQLRGSAGNGFYFKSSLDAADPALAHATMKSCCRLITAQKESAVLVASPPPKAAVKRDISFSGIKEGMATEEVLAGIGAPDHVSSESTGKQAIPFYFGSDTRRVSWSYTGVGFVVFSRNAYTGELRVVETKVDPKAP
jgi:hypothetical protein